MNSLIAYKILVNLLNDYFALQYLLSKSFQVVSSSCSSYLLIYSFLACRIMNTNNDSAVVQLGSNQTFSVESIACGLPIISWMDSQGRDIASGTTLTLTDIKKADAGVYRLVRRALFSDSVSSSGRRFPNSFAKSMSFFGYSIQPTAVLKT